MNQQATEAALKLWVVMHRAMDSVEGVLAQQVNGHGLSMTEFAVLEALLHKGAMPIGDIGSRVLRTSGSMTYVIDKLQRRGFLRRRACAKDRRVIYAELTQEGSRAIEAVFSEHAELLRQVMGGLTVEEVEKATMLLKRLGHHAAAYSLESA